MQWHAAVEGARRALERHACEHLGAEPGQVSSGRLCPRCASSDHGRPWLRVDGTTHQVSVSRSGPHLVTVVCDVPVGVDVESVAAVAARWDPALVLAVVEVARTDDEQARAWARKEAVLKRRGTGLATPMPEVVLAEERWCDLPAPTGYVAALSSADRAMGGP